MVSIIDKETITIEKIRKVSIAGYFMLNDYNTETDKKF